MREPTEGIRQEYLRSTSIHYQMDNLAGAQLGRSVAQVLIDWAEKRRLALRSTPRLQT